MEEVIPAPAHLDPRVSVGSSSVNNTLLPAHAFDHEPSRTARDGEAITFEHRRVRAMKAVT